MPQTGPLGNLSVDEAKKPKHGGTFISSSTIILVDLLLLIPILTFSANVNMLTLTNLTSKADEGQPRRDP